MKSLPRTLLASALAVGGAWTTQSLHAGLFKIDFGHIQNEAEILEYEVDFFQGEVFGNPTTLPTGEFPEPLEDWDVIPTWSFADPNAEVTEGSASIEGTANDEGTEVTWTLRDFAGFDSDVTLTMLDNVELAQSANPDSPPFMNGQIANNPTHEGFLTVDFDGNPVPLFPQIDEIAYDGVLVPFVVKDDYNYRDPDTANTEVLMRIANLDPGFYNVTVFEGRTTDTNGRRGRVWVGDDDPTGGPDAPNTGNYAGVTDGGTVLAWGQPRTVAVEVKEGEFLWFAEQEDNSGGISGMIIRSVDLAPPPADVTTSQGLFKIDFGHIENEREIEDADGLPTGEFPDPLADWNVIPTWSFGDPNANVADGSSSLEGVTNAEGNQTTWPLTDFSNDGNTNVEMTIMDNAALSSSTGQAPANGQIANNPTLELYDAVYDGVWVPAMVKDDYNYRDPDTGGTELLMRFSGLKAGSYNVTVFEGRTTDNNGRFGKVWVDDENGANVPAEQNTGNYSGVVIVDGNPIMSVDGQPRTVTVTIEEGQHIWFAEMEDNSGGISGLIIRGVEGGSAAPPTEPAPEPAMKVASSSGPLTEPTVVDFGALEGDASYEFYFTAVKDGASTAIAGNDSFAIKLDQWNEQGVFGTTAFGVADNLFTAVDGQSVASVFDEPVHVVVVNDTGAGEARLYINGVLSGNWAGNFELPGSTKVMGARLEQATDHMGEGSTMLSWATFDGVLTAEEITSLFESRPQPAVLVASSSGPLTEPTVVDFGALDGDASYEFYFTAVKDGASTAIAGNNSFAIKLDQWNEQGLFGTTAFGVADNLFTAVEGQSVASVFDRPVHVVVVNDTGAGESRLYVDGTQVGTWMGNFVLPGDTKVMGARLEQATDHMGEGSEMHSWATYDGALTGDEIASLYAGLASPGDAPTVSIVNNGDGTITVTFTGVLQAAAAVTGPYEDVTDQSPLTIPADQAAQFARARQP